jgi:hypothetical protein
LSRALTACLVTSRQRRRIFAKCPGVITERGPFNSPAERLCGPKRRLCHTQLLDVEFACSFVDLGYPCATQRSFDGRDPMLQRNRLTISFTSQGD